MITKFSFATIVPIRLLLRAGRPFFFVPMRTEIISTVTITGCWYRAVWMTIIFLSTLVLAYLAVWSAYGFHYDAVAVQCERLAIAAAIKSWSWLTSWVCINAEYHQLPKAWLLDFVYALSTFNRAAYLLG